MIDSFLASKESWMNHFFSVVCDFLGKTWKTQRNLLISVKYPELYYSVAKFRVFLEKRSVFTPFIFNKLQKPVYNKFNKLQYVSMALGFNINP